MGSAISRCTTRNSGATSGLAEIGQKILDRQPNWLITPTRWRSQTCAHQPVRYRTPTPYPKDDRKRLEESAHVHMPEKAVIIETPVVSHLELAEPPHKQAPMRPHIPHVQLPQPALTITWELHPRLNRFERVP
ncbi:hypothetical protein MFIFM68171_08055 [Madurella fahalii]|uniref:Uncharacterized protein n=1 Tax=Madurella fahalii TaxID=1157608 RepID=A0ABQ0GJF7_9PEZI